MARQIKILYSSLLATSAMTLFSYLYSIITNNNTREPELLAKLMHRLAPRKSLMQSRYTGWLVHYSVGLLFAELYDQIWQKQSKNVNGRAGLIFGGLSGISAILIWKFTLAIHPFPPTVNFGSFALNLFLAHLVFGLCSALAYQRS
jgi:hypothetical protein